MKRCVRLMAVGGMLVLAACGGGHGNSTYTAPVVTPATNVQDVVVDSGPLPTTQPSVNTLFTSVTLCVPGTNTCQTIDHIQVDTGSFGLRILSSALSLSLAPQTFTTGEALLECTQFVDGYSWGPVALADVDLAGETVASVPVQVIGDARYPTVPDDCATTGTQEDTVTAFGANGVLGIGVFKQDCGSFCADATQAQSGGYYACTSSACDPTAVPLDNQVLNPVSLLATNNNGTIIDLSAVAAGGANGVAGSLIYGIDTQSNNSSSGLHAYTLDGSAELTTVFNGQQLTESFIDSGSNGIYFNSTIPVCASPLDAFYCPTTTQTLSATIVGTNSLSVVVNFTIGNASDLTSGAGFDALPTLGGTNPNTNSFDWGLPFFYGRKVANIIEESSATVGSGPAVAF
jgi:Protein of unknown function (DUF3443)